MRVPPTLPDGIYTGVLQIAGVQSNSITVALARNAHFANWSAANSLPGYGARESLMTAQNYGRIVLTLTLSQPPAGIANPTTSAALVSSATGPSRRARSWRSGWNPLPGVA